MELAIVLPVLLLFALAALDLGRVFLGWVVLNNAARVGANYAAIHPDAWGTPGDAAERTQYENLVRDARADTGIALDGCPAQAVPAPAFPSGTALGDFAQLDLDCQFVPLTPLIGDIFASSGNQLTVSARSVFPIRTGLGSSSQASPPPSPPPTCPSADFRWDVPDPLVWRAVQFTDLSEGEPDTWTWDFGDGSALASEQSPSHAYADDGAYTVTLTVDKGTECEESSLPRDITIAEGSTGDPPPPVDCIVPNFAGTQKSAAQTTWGEAGFTTLVDFRPPPQEYEIQYQSLVGGQEEPCGAAIEVGPNPGGGGGGGGGGGQP